MAATSYAVFLFIIAALLAAITEAGVTVLSSSKLEKCALDGGGDTNQTLSCSEKLVVLLSITAEDVSSAELRLFVSSISNGTDTKDLQQPMVIKLTMSPITVTYPITYLQHVNARPYEHIIITDLFTGCDDGDYSDTPTCGWQNDENGNPISFSQGFCCSCTLDDLFGGKSLTRADMDCNIFGDLYSASCLRFSEQWYQLYEIGPYSIDWKITATIEFAGEVRQVFVSPSQPIALDPEGKVLVRLIGDFAPTTETPSFLSKYLLTPTHVTDMRKWVDEWMIIDKTEADLTGRTCNKVGVGYYAFRYEGDRCRKPAGSCLRNQPSDLRNEDEERIAQGKAPNYLLRRWGTPFIPSSDYGRRLSFIDRQRRASMLTIETVADSIQWIVYLSSIKILQAQVKDFEATSRDGLIVVTLFNKGNLPASVHVTVTDCPNSIQAVPSQQLTLVPSQVDIVYFNIYSTALEPNYSTCNVSVWNEMGELEDSILVGFNVTLPNDNFADQGGPSGPGTNTDVVYEDGMNCGCGGFDLLCYAATNCWKPFLVMSLVIIAIIAIIVIVIKLRRVLCCCCPRCRKGKSTKGIRRKDVKKLASAIQSQLPTTTPISPHSSAHSTPQETPSNTPAKKILSVTRVKEKKCCDDEQVMERAAETMKELFPSKYDDTVEEEVAYPTEEEPVIGEETIEVGIYQENEFSIEEEESRYTFIPTPADCAEINYEESTPDNEFQDTNVQ